jgi:4-hydroxyphenylacetate 3-monooxygenase
MEINGEKFGEYFIPNKRFLYASLAVSQPLYSDCLGLIKNFSGASAIGIPSKANFSNPNLRSIYHKISGGDMNSWIARSKTLNLMWDVIGSEFGSRHEQYEKFYAGSANVVHQHAFRTFSWEVGEKMLGDYLSSYDLST